MTQIVDGSPVAPVSLLYPQRDTITTAELTADN